MLGALFIAPGEAALPNPWKPWLDHLLSQQGDYHVQRAALTYTDGKPAAASKDFVLSLAEVKKLHPYFTSSDDQDTMVFLRGKSYVVKQTSDRQLVAFNGNKYLIICRSRRMFVTVVCKAKRKHQNGASQWMARLTNNLIAKGY